MALVNIADCIEKKTRASVGVRVVANQDRTIDGQASVQNIPEGVAPNRMLILLEQCVRDNAVTNAWLSILLRFGAQTEGERAEMIKKYTRFRGMFQIETYSKRMTKGKIPHTFAGGRLIRKRASGKNRQLVQVLIRVYWAPDGKRPPQRRGFERKM